MNARPENPFRPGAGHLPPYLAGRQQEQQEFAQLLGQAPVLTNLVLTGLRGVGKTVLLETLKPIAIQQKWLWAGTDLSESATVSEESIAVRILADLAPLVANVVVAESETRRIGFGMLPDKSPMRLDYGLLKRVYDQAPGLVSDKLKAVFELVWKSLRTATAVRGIVLAYDEAQNLSDRAERQQYPLSLMLDVFQSIQKKQMPFLLVLAGLPTLFPKLVEARTFAERMFHTVTLGRLTAPECREAILRPLEHPGTTVRFTEATVNQIIRHSGGYPYFIQFLSREMFDACVQPTAEVGFNPVSTVLQTVRKLDSDFFAGRWNRVTERQQQLLVIVAELPNCNEEFTVQEIVEQSRKPPRKPFSSSHVSQLLASLAASGLVYKHRHGRYSFAVPLLGDFIRRQKRDTEAAPG